MKKGLGKEWGDGGGLCARWDNNSPRRWSTSAFGAEKTRGRGEREGIKEDYGRDCRKSEKKNERQRRQFRKEIKGGAFPAGGHPVLNPHIHRGAFEGKHTRKSEGKREHHHRAKSWALSAKKATIQP